MWHACGLCWSWDHVVSALVLWSPRSYLDLSGNGIGGNLVPGLFSDLGNLTCVGPGTRALCVVIGVAGPVVGAVVPSPVPALSTCKLRESVARRCVVHGWCMVSQCALLIGVGATALCSDPSRLLNLYSNSLTSVTPGAFAGLSKLAYVT